MFEDRTYKRTFYSAPQSVTSLVAAFLEPAITVLTFLAANWYFDEPANRPELTLCLLVFALTFPGRNRFRDNLLAAAVDIASSWVTLVAILALCGYATRHGIRAVFITLPLGSQPRIVELLEQLQGTTASLFFVPDVFGISIIQGRLQDMNGVPVVGICETPFTGTNELVKRLSDIVIASVIVILISPLLIAIAIGVKLSSPGPVLFRQRRNGLDGHEIVVYKFRAMRAQ